MYERRSLQTFISNVKYKYQDEYCSWKYQLPSTFAKPVHPVILAANNTHEGNSRTTNISLLHRVHPVVWLVVVCAVCFAGQIEWHLWWLIDKVMNEIDSSIDHQKIKSPPSPSWSFWCTPSPQWAWGCQFLSRSPSKGNLWSVLEPSRYNGLKPWTNLFQFIFAISVFLRDTAVRALVWNNGTLLCKIDFNRNLSF